jgi:hypothetical protein
MWDEFATDVGWRVSGYEPHYEGSAVVFGPAGGKSSAHGEHLVKARAGHHLTPRKLSAGGNTFDVLGAEFTLLAFDAPDDAVAAFELAAASLYVPLKVARDTYADERTGYAARLILVRPDQYVVWTGDRAPDDAAAILRRVTGRA